MLPNKRSQANIDKVEMGCARFSFSLFFASPSAQTNLGPTRPYNPQLQILKVCQFTFLNGMKFANLQILRSKKCPTFGQAWQKISWGRELSDKRERDLDILTTASYFDYNCHACIRCPASPLKGERIGADHSVCYVLVPINCQCHLRHFSALFVSVFYIISIFHPFALLRVCAHPWPFTSCKQSMGGIYSNTQTNAYDRKPLQQR